MSRFCFFKNQISWQRILALVALALILPISGSASAQPYAEWCQCAIFVVNHLGLEIIPGDYWTAGSFVIPDEAGKTWMEYQGFSRRPDGENPERGDVVVIRPNGRVYFPESEGSQNLVLVNADPWAGHIGVIDAAEETTVAGLDYWQITFLSSNWGVNATSMFVRSGCFNVDRSVVLVEKGYQEVSFWKQTAPELQRRHILNIARQLANGNYHLGIDGTVDGYPVSGQGLIAYAWNVDLTPGGSIEEILTANAVEVPPGAIQPGDALMLTDEGSIFGIYTGADGNGGDWFKSGFAYRFAPSAGTMQGPELLADFLTPQQAAHVHVYRSKAIAPDLLLEGFEIRTEADGTVTATYLLRNQGGKTVTVNSASVRIASPQGSLAVGSEVVENKTIEVPAGQEYVYKSEITVMKSGVYLLQPTLVVDGKVIYFPEMEKVQYFQRNQD
jgi:hypothetical protein